MQTFQLWQADQGDGTYRNPILFADYSDPDVVRVGDDFYLVASSFNCTPGVPILHSKDLVNWTIINHVLDRLPFEVYNQPAHGCGVWAPSIRFHAGKFWVFFSTPDEGIFMSTAADPAGAWSPLTLVQAAKGWIDPCPFWDDDGQAYLVHAFAASRAGIKSILHICRMKPDGTALLDEGRLVFDGRAHHPTIEGPKLYKRNGYYYIFAPAGGVPTGWQTVLRSTSIYGPYEDRIVMAQGRTEVNGPHQGGWVELASGEDWFVHFQDRGAYGRIVHLQPLKWVDEWPIIGLVTNGDGVGEPVSAWRKPNIGRDYPIAVPQTSDEFEAATLGRQWQWHANPKSEWMSLEAHPGHLRLYAQPVQDLSLRLAPNLLLQKFPAPAFTITTLLTLAPQRVGAQAGLVVMGDAYAYVALAKTGNGYRLVQCAKSDAEQAPREVESLDWQAASAHVRVSVRSGAVCRFSVSQDGQAFTPIGGDFQARAGRWIGAKVGLFCARPDQAVNGGWADFDWFRFSSLNG